MGQKIFRHKANIEAEVFAGSCNLLLTGLSMVSVVKTTQETKTEDLGVIENGSAIMISKSELHALISILLDCQAELKGVTVKKAPVRPKY